ncbi:MAG: ATP-binding protein [Chloroflexota bacterium]|nr:ATP-binding protein [Chloroflexota bacterium]
MSRITQVEGQLGREALTARQRDVAALVARGYTNQQIAAELVIGQGTAANHVQQILRRTGLASRAELAAWASQRGLATDQNRLLSTLERLLEIDPSDLDSALDAAAQAVAEALGADKVDAFLFDSSTATLVARGTSQTPMGRKQHALGLDRLPVTNGGRMAEIFELGTFRHSGRVDQDPLELRGIRLGLGVRSDISVPLEVAGVRAGVLTAVSAAPEFFSDSDLRYLATVSRWVGMVAHRAELVRLTAAEGASRSRTAAAEELITVLAHDFRNYLSPLRGRLELLERRARRDGHDRFVRDAHELIASVDRLDHLVRDLLDTARLEQGLFDLSQRPVDLLELVEQTVADLAPDQRAEVRARVDELVVSADPSRLRQVLENLLTNALKVQPKTEPVVIELEADPCWATVTIVDRGPGIPSEVLPRLFQRFSRGSGSIGLGLGLYLARGITEAHGGSLDVDSSVGGGARFGVRLPLDGAALTGAEAVETGRPSAQHDVRPSVRHNGSGNQEAIPETR